MPAPPGLRLSWHWLLLPLLLATVPAQAMYKCVADRKTTFQEQPCQPGAVQTVIRTPSAEATAEPVAAPAPMAAASAATGSTDQEKLDVMEAERLRRDAAYVLRDKLAQLANQQASCERNFGVSFSRGGPNGSISGAVFQQSTLGETNAAASRCIARTNAIQQEVGAARAQCVLRGCAGP
ncbi:MAG: hypothetical protein EOP76_11315 [Variovorax sp.]|nr:MAG: hypothetical protein EOP76_11315 [Variovorax sp.]